MSKRITIILNDEEHKNFLIYKEKEQKTMQFLIYNAMVKNGLLKKPKNEKIGNESL